MVSHLLPILVSSHCISLRRRWSGSLEDNAEAITDLNTDAAFASPAHQVKREQAPFKEMIIGTSRKKDTFRLVSRCQSSTARWLQLTPTCSPPVATTSPSASSSTLRPQKNLVSCHTATTSRASLNRTELFLGHKMKSRRPQVKQWSRRGPTLPNISRFRFVKCDLKLFNYSSCSPPLVPPGLQGVSQ